MQQETKNKSCDCIIIFTLLQWSRTKLGLSLRFACIHLNTFAIFTQIDFDKVGK